MKKNSATQPKTTETKTKKNIFTLRKGDLQIVTGGVGGVHDDPPPHP